MSYRDTMIQPQKTRLLKRIARKRGDVFLRADFDDLGGYDQVGRVLRQLVRQGALMKIGFGLYARAVQTPFSDAPVPSQGLMTLAEALKRLNIKIAPSRLEQDYNACRTRRVSATRAVPAARSPQARAQRNLREL